MTMEAILKVIYILKRKVYVTEIFKIIRITTPLSNLITSIICHELVYHNALVIYRKALVMIIN